MDAPRRLMASTFAAGAVSMIITEQGTPAGTSGISTRMRGVRMAARYTNAAASRIASMEICRVAAVTTPMRLARCLQRRELNRHGVQPRQQFLVPRVLGRRTPGEERDG